MVKSIYLFFILYVTGVPYFDTAAANINVIKDSRNEHKVKNSNTVKIIFLYETHCPLSVQVYPHVLEVVQKLRNYIHLQTYPYGRAKMTNDSGIITVECQHGEAECYGNKLHACAIDLLKDVDNYVDFNACLMASNSTDLAADKCGNLKNVDSQAIKTCAKGKKGQELLIYYGKESLKIYYTYVSFVLINGQEKPVEKPLWNAVCESFEIPP